MTSKTVLCTGLIALGVIVSGSRPVQAQGWSAPGLYSFPAWSQKILGGERFVVLTALNGEAVLDIETGLVWHRAPSTAHVNYFNAVSQCESQQIAGRFGWRLPFIHELTSLLDPGVGGSGPFLPARHPFTIPGAVGDSVYWSATSSASNPAVDAATATFFASPSVGTAPKLNLYYYWCVRGGNSARP